MLIAYGGYIFFQLNYQKNSYIPINEVGVSYRDAEHASTIIFAVKDKLVSACLLFIINIIFQNFFSKMVTIIIIHVMPFWSYMHLNYVLRLQDGTSDYFKELILVFSYLIVAASFFVHMDPRSMHKPWRRGL
ncbi:hypothetical protein HanRHA438_Chr10g0464881 [Helianthus annuus]|uniref:Uncharacterized protein n=1 Tax=Helianthus annuus TaxID=4232 RepID=A0A9K3HZT9_HELAN|nr:hypothetical protein HanXRQr2_Chr10g0452031 [Helianthus annuus]KAJ0697639.1 putative calcium/proton exchanger [Helianthus annuus]KAJ0880593.1 hypothetical protein HanRHA438_Chr10g0464881 [Helianthus annuus]